MKKLMIIGAGENQVPIINMAKNLGFYTIAVSIDGDYPGFKICDKEYKVDVREKELILEIARNEKVCGILTDQTDIAIPTVAYVSEMMDLPSIGYDCALSFTNKFKMRNCCENLTIAMIGYRQAASFEEAQKLAFQLRLPIILKPVDNQGSRGVCKINQYEELEDRFNDARKHSASGYVILEEFFQGREVVIEGMAINYKFTNLIIGDSENFDIPDVFIPKQRIFPTLLNNELKNRILSINKALVEKLKLKFGITHSEYLIDENTGEICLMEIAARGGGVFISSDLIPLACHIDVNDMLIRLCTGENVEIDMQNYVEASSGYICFALPEGIIKKVSGVSEIKSLPGVHKIFMDNILVGNRIQKMKDKTSRLGPILFGCQNRKLLQNTIEMVKNILKIEVETENGTKGIIW